MELETTWTRTDTMHTSISLSFIIKDYYLISKSHISYQDWNQVNQPTSEYMFPTMASKLQHSPLELEISEYFILIWQNQIKLRFKQ